MEKALRSRSVAQNAGDLSKPNHRRRQFSGYALACLAISFLSQSVRDADAQEAGQPRTLRDRLARLVGKKVYLRRMGDRDYLEVVKLAAVFDDYFLVEIADTVGTKNIIQTRAYPIASILFVLEYPKSKPADLSYPAIFIK